MTSVSINSIHFVVVHQALPYARLQKACSAVISLLSYAGFQSARFALFRNWQICSSPGLPSGCRLRRCLVRKRWRIIHGARRFWLDAGPAKADLRGSAEAELKSALIFLLQSIVIGLAVAFLIVLLRPDLLPIVGVQQTAPPFSYADAVDRSAPAVANVFTKRLIPESGTPTARTRFKVSTNFASGVIIDPEGYIVTNYHVVAEAAEIRIQLSDGGFAEPDLVGVDPETDLAVLKIDVPELPAIPFGSSANLRIGDVVLAIGNPYGLTASVTQGIVSATGRGNLKLVTFENFIQTDAAINAGNSGGALVNARGELVGINTAVLAQDPGTEGIGFAIPVDLVRGVVEQIKQHGRVIRGWLGMQPDDLTAAERESRGLDNDSGVYLSVVYEGGPADRAGLQQGDVVLTINGEAVVSQRQALLVAAGMNPGESVDVSYIRDGERFTTTVVAGERPQVP
ncbi:MAG: PDZ domain-containing protein [Woeseiaceae bacterium]|nr:PDZ domain-containing protein [Woeseiaceae bacterium]